MTFESRLRRVEGECAIRGLVANYCIAVDDRDFAALNEMFTRDAAFISSFDEVRGHEAVLTFLADLLAGFGATTHVSMAPSIRWIDDHHATGIVSTRSELVVSGRYLLSSYRYLDEYALEEGIWRFRSRTTQPLYVLEPARIPKRFGTSDAVEWPATEEP